MRVYCDSLGRSVDLPDRPQRIVSLVSSATEALATIGCLDRIAGVSSYCRRYVPNLTAPVVGDYLSVDEDLLREIEPDLVITTTGVQRGVGKGLSHDGYPVFAIPLPNSLHGILEGVMLLGALVGEMDAARDLVHRWTAHFEALRADAPPTRPRVYAELWFGAYQRTPGGLTFIHDLLEAAGAQPLFGDVARSYLNVDVGEVEHRRPDVAVVFSEPEYPVDAAALVREREWNVTLPHLALIQSDVTRGRNLIHDGPSMMETATWLHGRIREAVAQ